MNNHKSLQIFLILIGIQLITYNHYPFIVCSNDITNDTILKKSLKNVNQDSSLIYINGETDFRTQASLYGWDLGGTRDGTETKPFIISGNNETNNEKNFIEIYNTQLHFIIENNTFDAIEGQAIGFKFTNVSFGVINNNFLQRLEIGIEINPPFENITLFNNSISSIETGIHVNAYNDFGNGCNISHNKIMNFNEGVNIQEVWNGVYITNNNFTNGVVAFETRDSTFSFDSNYLCNIQAGISTLHCIDCKVENNKFIKINYTAIHLDPAIGHTVTNNSFISCRNGVSLYAFINFSEDNIISKNSFINITETAIDQFTHLRNTQIFENIVQNASIGIDCNHRGNNNYVFNNSIFNSGVGMNFFYSEHILAQLESEVHQSVNKKHTSVDGDIVISKNTIINSSSYAVICEEDTNNLLFRHNMFISNNINGSSQAADNGTDHVFVTNYWNEWSGLDDNNDGFLDQPYPIDGTAINFDQYALTNETAQNKIIPAVFSLDQDPFFGNVTINWNPAAELFGNNITYSLFYSLNNSLWISLISNIEETSFLWDTTTITDGSNYQLKLDASSTHGLNTTTLSDYFPIDNHAPEVQLVEVSNNSKIISSVPITLKVTDSTAVSVVYNWNGALNRSLQGEDFFTIPTIFTDGNHSLSVFATDALGRTSTRYYSFYVNVLPEIFLLTASNTSLIPLQKDIYFEITDLSLTTSWYSWDEEPAVTLEEPFIVPNIGSPGHHTLTIGARDTWNDTTLQNFVFYILQSPSIELTQQPPAIAYSGKTFNVSYIISNHESVTLTIDVFTTGKDDKVLSGNNSQVIISPNKTGTVSLSIKPLHASTHQVGIEFLINEITYTQETLVFYVRPFWLSPLFIFQFSALFIVPLLLILLFVYQALKRREEYQLFLDQQAKLTDLVDRLLLLQLEEQSSEETTEPQTDEIQSNVLTFQQLQSEYHVLKECICSNSDLNRMKLKELLTQAEDLINELQRKFE